MDAESRHPLEGCRASLQRYPEESGQERQTYSPEATLADGRFHLRFVPPPGGNRYHLHVDGPGRAPRNAWFGDFEPGQTTDR